MATKTAKTKTTGGNSLTENCIPELSNQQAYTLVNVLEHPQCGHVSRVYITADGYFFSPGNDLHEMVDLDAKIPAEAALLKIGKKQKKILLPGKYIARKPVLKEYTREEILEKKDKIVMSYKL